MDSQQTFTYLLEQLDYKDSPSFISSDIHDNNAPPEMEDLWNETKEKLSVDAIYYIASTPVIYFKRFEAFDTELIADFHRKVWNQSQVPLIFVILPNDIRIYNGYDAPRRTASNNIIEPNRIDNKLRISNNIWERLEVFTRSAIESGSFWRDYGHFFKKENRADQTLIANLRYIRRQMISQGGLNPEYAHSLIGRSIFAFYLQDRGVLPVGEQGFFSKNFKKPYLRYTDLLSSYEDTYAFFEILRTHFNGDMFPVTREEKDSVNSTHLNMLHNLFAVDSQSGGQLLFFWAYNFAFIPIELISSIYEEFLYQEESGKNGAYYTRPMLVDFMLDQAMPWQDPNYKIRLLDPACGSGIFLVEAYRRLIERWKRVHNEQRLSFAVLSEILTTSIFGVDIKRQALRVAAFSLYLAMLDYLEPKSIWMDVVFPTLIGINLVEVDFFDEQISLKMHKFDLVIGNPPWQSKLTSHAKLFLQQNKLKVGDKQIVQAFLWNAPKFCTPNGQIVLLCSSKSLLFNQSGPNISFRHDFFRQFHIKKIFDFSALRRFLFEKGIAPAAAIFYSPSAPPLKANIFYGAPKPTALIRLLSAMVIDASDLKQFPLLQVLDSVGNSQVNSSQGSVSQKTLFDEEIDNDEEEEIDNDEEEEIDNDEEEEEEEEKKGSPSEPINLWKVALWGTSYDYSLLQDLNNYPSLKEVIMKLGWDAGSGFIRKGPGESKLYPWLDNAPFLESKDLTRYGINKNKLKVLPTGVLYHRGRTSKRFKAPLVLFKRGQAQRRPSAAFLDEDCTYTNAITSITGPHRDLLKALTALLNSELVQYYLFLTSSSWGVEREEIKAGEMRTIPFPFLEVDQERINAICTLVDELATMNTNVKFKSRNRNLQMFDDGKEGRIESLEQELNYHIYQCFNLGDQEIQLIQETLQYTVGFFNSPENSLAQQKPSFEMQYSYAKTYLQLLNFYLEPIGRKLTATIFNEDMNTSPLRVIQFASKHLDANIPDIEIVKPEEQMLKVLPKLQRLSIDPFSRGMYHRRNFRIYDRITDTVSIIKPAEKRLWTTSAALNDAEETLTELSQPMKV